MRLGRIILLASLAQILGLPALAAVLSEHPAFTGDSTASSESHAWEQAAPAALPVLVTPYNPHSWATSQAVLAVTALSDTSLRHSVWMVAPAVRTAEVPRPRQHLLLRC